MGPRVTLESEASTMTLFERVVLAIPTNTLYKLSYAWFGVVIFFDWAPGVSAFLAVCLLVRVIVPKIQRRVWEKKVVRDHAVETAHIDRPRLSLARQGVNLALAVVGSGILAYLLDGSLGLSAIEWGLLSVGFFIFQMDAKLFGSPTTYIVTDDGVGIYSSSLRLFLTFDEIEQAVYVEEVESPPARWAILAPSQDLSRGVLFVPRERAGFTRLIDHVALAPDNPQEFISHLPPRLAAAGGDQGGFYG